MTVFFIFLLFFFFFSSRRRHTRCLSDWSSDVCSSDLGTCPACATSYIRVLQASTAPPSMRIPHEPQIIIRQLLRSEERRVGKECRSRWSPSNEKKKIMNKKIRLNANTTIERTHKV